MKRCLPLSAVLFACACLPFSKSVGEASETEGSTGLGSDEGASSGTVPLETGNTSIEPPSSSASATSTTGSASTDDLTTDPTADPTGAPPSFECPPQPGEDQCDPLAQDCPSGFHCVPWSDAIDVLAKAFVCAPLVDEPIERYEACPVDQATCSDPCEAGMFCMHSNYEGTSGLCLGMCGSDGDDEACAADEKCVTCADCSVGMCLPSCDPLAPQCPDETPSCLWYPPDGFVCTHGQYFEGALGEVCEYVNWCAEGLACADASLMGGSCAGATCCTEVCDLADGDPACSDPGHVCISPFLPGPAPEGSEHVGMCGVPEADPCLTPGVCPPPDIDDTYPWCSESNEAYCLDGGLAGYFNDITCESGCLCQAPCMDDGDCSQPPTGTAVPECVEEPYGLGSPTSCLLRCGGGETCPDGMTCTDALWGEPVCTWISPVPPEEC